MVGHCSVGRVSLLVGNNTSGIHALGQRASRVLCIHARRMKAEFAIACGFYGAAAALCETPVTQVTQNAVCSRHQSEEPQPYRSLRRSLDRFCGGGLTLTHQVIAALLGLRRDGMTEAATDF